MNLQSLTEITNALKHKKLSSVELTQHYLNRIRENQALNSFISVDEHHSLAMARIADEKREKNNIHSLTGIPIAHKDNFCTHTLPTTCGSKMLENFTSPYQATLVEQLDAQGVVLLGKTNMDEFAMGSTNESSFFGPVKNPWDISRVPGGSSGGSAAAVAASLCAFATGSDTGGSVRQPAAFCGVSGLKPTYGLISRFGMVAYASSLDTAGIIARTAEDLATILPAIAKWDEKDSTSAYSESVDYLEKIQEPIGKLRVGLPQCFFHNDVDTDIQNAVKQAVNVFEQCGAEIIEIDLSLHAQWVPCYYVIACAEASSNLSRYDGIRYGHRSKHSDSLQTLITQSREEGFGMEVKRRILTGTHVLSAGYYDAYYLQAQKVRRMIRNELNHALNDIDIILGPTTPTCAFNLNETVTSPTQRYLADVFTVGANLAGLPALSIPGGFNSQGLPIGIQLMGSHFSEARLLQIAHAYQQITDWHTMQPSVQERQ